MKAFKRTIDRILSDLLEGRHIESYTLSAMAAIMTLLGVVGDIVPTHLLLAAILASVGLLVFNLTAPEKSESKLDDILHDRETFIPFRHRIKNARTVWIVGPSVINLLDPNIPYLKTEIFDQVDGECRVIVQDPSQTDFIELMEKQVGGGIDYSTKTLTNDLQNTLVTLRRIKSWEIEGNFDYRFVAYNPGFSMVAIDPNKSEGIILLEFHGFHNAHITKRMSIEITKSLSSYWYSYWLQQFEYMWKVSRKDKIDKED